LPQRLRSRQPEKEIPPVARIFIVLALLFPIIEIAVLIKVGQSIGLWPTLALVVGAAVLGVVLLRLEGVNAITRLGTSLRQGRIPGSDVADVFMLGIAGVLLLLPGFVTDIAALALLLPPVRHGIYRWLASRVRVVDTTTSYRSYTGVDDPRLGRPSTIDLDDDDYRPR
jgi:UPF0716 protein FxsA